MRDSSPTTTQQRRDLFPRSPSDIVVGGLLIVGTIFAITLKINWYVALGPGAAAKFVQTVRGHVRAWRGKGVERAFVMESTAISFYVIVALAALAGALEASGVPRRIDVAWLPGAALFVDTVVRSFREHR